MAMENHRVWDFDQFQSIRRRDSRGHNLRCQWLEKLSKPPIWNLEESLKIYCFIAMEIGDEEGRVFQYFGTSYILLRPSLSIGSFYPCLPKIQSCKTVYLHQNVMICDNSEIVPSSMSGSKKVFLPFLYLGGVIAAERIKIWVSLVLQIKILPNLSRVVCVREGFCSDHIGIVFAFMGIGDPSLPGFFKPFLHCAILERDDVCIDS
ncbi:hypothetical protein V6N13_032163 [Hibiscus sabdariffa]